MTQVKTPDDILSDTQANDDFLAYTPSQAERIAKLEQAERDRALEKQLPDEPKGPFKFLSGFRDDIVKAVGFFVPIAVALGYQWDIAVIENAVDEFWKVLVTLQAALFGVSNYFKKISVNRKQ